jgi:succinate dehydrogenase / fumarate reductase cytochrome b subunit
MATPERPLSPFMLGSYYRFQLTSTLSLLHRATGVVLALGSVVLLCWLVSAAFLPEHFAQLSACLASLPGRIVLFLFSAALIYHFLNGIRHLMWDAGHGYEIPKAYASGWAVVVLTLVLTAALWLFAIGGAA